MTLPGVGVSRLAAPPRAPTSWRRRLCGGRRRRGQWGALAPPSGAPVRGPRTSSIEVGGTRMTSAACRPAYDVFAPSGRRSYADRKRVAAALRPIYTAPTVDAAETELLAFAESDLGKRYPATVATWENAWQRFIPFLAFPPELRRIIYTTNSIESLNYQLRKIIKNRGHFPNDDAAIKLLWLAIRDIEDKRARARAKEKGLPPTQRTAPGRLVEGATVQGWKAALGALALAYPDRLAGHLT